MNSKGNQLLQKKFQINPNLISKFNKSKNTIDLLNLDETSDQVFCASGYSAIFINELASKNELNAEKIASGILNKVSVSSLSPEEIYLKTENLLQQLLDLKIVKEQS